MRAEESPHTPAYLLIQRGFIELDGGPGPFRTQNLLEGIESNQSVVLLLWVVSEMLSIGPRSRQNNILVPGSAR